MKEFKIKFGEEQLDELRKRIDATRLPDNLNIQSSWGVNGNDLPPILAYWHNDYNWSRKAIV